MFTHHHIVRRRVGWAVAACAAAIVAAVPTAVAAHARESSRHTVQVTGALSATFLDIGMCTAPGDVVPVTIDAHGRLSGLGRTSLHLTASATCIDEYLLGEVTHLRGAYSAANGDRLVFRGVGSPIAFEGNDDWSVIVGRFGTSDHFTWGTGRFAGVTGEQTISVTHVMTAPELQMTLTVAGELRLPDAHHHHG